jgi:hypothetical protein
MAAFPEAGRAFPGGSVPAQLLQQLAAIVTVWGTAEVGKGHVAWDGAVMAMLS